MEQIKSEEKPNVMRQLAAFIVDKRVMIYILFAAACVYCVLSIGKVRINSDITAFLSEDTETRRGLTIMEEFVTYASADVMVANVTYDMAERMAEDIAEPEDGTEPENDTDPNPPEEE